MAQNQTSVPTKNTGDTLSSSELNDIVSTVNDNGNDAETRLASTNGLISPLNARISALEATSTGVLSYTTANLPASVSQNGSLAFDTDLGALVYYSAGAWFKVSDGSFWVNNSPSSAWTPAQLTNSYWWDASDASTIVESLGSVSSWSDKNQTSIISQSNAVLQPTTNLNTINSLNSIYFDGTDTLTGPVLSLLEFSKYIVFKRNTHTGANLLSNAGGLADAIWSGGGSDKLVSFLDNNSASGTTVLNLGQTYLGCQIKDSLGVTDLFLNGALEANHTNNVGTGGQALEVGTFIGSNGLDGDIAEIVLIPLASPQGERETVEGYLAHKWGFASDLPSGHPYSSAPPTV